MSTWVESGHLSEPWHRQLLSNSIRSGLPSGRAARRMITRRIFEWAVRTPERTAVIYNGQRWSYRLFAELIATARGYFAERGYAGSGYAVLVVWNRMDFWILSLALRSLGLTTVAVPAANDIERLGLPYVRCAVTSSLEQ